MLILVGLIVFGVALVATISLAVRRSQQSAGRKAKDDLSSGGGEREVYERLYGRRSMTVSAAVPAARPPKPDMDSPEAGKSE